ncbi:MAG: glycoside hydrolase family 10 protein [Candidatus Nanopelagicales bacterium]
MKPPHRFPSPRPYRFATALIAAAGLAVGALVTGIAPAAPASARVPQVELPAPGACPVDPRFKKHDFRAMWIASVANVDWPSRPGLSAQTQQAELRAWLDLAVKNNFNAVVLQVRPAADAIWPSSFEPWSTWLTGKQGKDPGYDPLAFAVDEAHKRNLDLHAWFNPYRVSMNTKLGRLAPSHPARAHPDWIVRKDGKLYYNPGIPEVREFVTNAIMDAVTRYDVDGVHFDDYFYPYPGSGRPFRDAKAFAAYGGAFPSKADWRRANIDALIKGLHDRINAVKPWVQFGVSPFAVWRNDSTHDDGSRTKAGIETYDDLYADTRLWVREGWIDYVAPQIYWTRGFKIARYGTIARWWAREVASAAELGHNVGLYIGEATYRAGTSTNRQWRKRQELSRHLGVTAQIPEVRGNIYFSAKDVLADRRGTTTALVKRWYTRPALLPVVGDSQGSAPQEVTAVSRDKGSLRWTGSDPSAASYAIYRVTGSSPGACDLADARNLVATVRRTGEAMTWSDPGKGDAVADSAYVVTAVDRNGRESAGAVAQP